MKNCYIPIVKKSMIFIKVSRKFLIKFKFSINKHIT